MSSGVEHSYREELLILSLGAAVPLWVERVRRLSDRERTERLRACGDAIAHHGDIILFRSKKAGETAENFNRLAEGLALLSFAPGGVKAFGQRWESKP